MVVRMSVPVRLGAWAFGVVATGGLLFGLAGRLDLPVLWAYWALTALGILARNLVIDPDLIRERLHPGPGAKDREDLWAIGVAFLAHLVLATLDIGRFHWSDTVPPTLQALGFVAYAVGLALSVWAMGVNRFFSSVIRIQQERGQIVITSGPYRFIRHPGYAGGLLFALGSPLALGSWVSLLPVVVMVAALLRRTVLEDRVLLQDLPGYPEYAEQVPYRLIPGIW